ncbi:MAG: hypothetical protein ACRBF0_13780 [Calditrichia bacterium]
MSLTKLVLICVFLIACYWLLTSMGNRFNKNNSELINFAPSNFSYEAAKPIYYYSDQKLYYHGDGILDLGKQPVWNGKLARGYSRSVYVSPNAQYVAVNDNAQRITLLDNTGMQLTTIAPLNRSLLHSDRRSRQFWGEKLQWNAESNRLYLMADKKWVENYSPENRSALYSYSIAEDKLSLVRNLDEECYLSFYLSPDEQSLFYSFSDEAGRIAYKQISIASGEVENVFYKDERGNIEIPSENIFINYRNEQFGNSSLNLEQLVTSVGGKEGGLYHYNKTASKRLIKGKYGEGRVKDYVYSFLKSGEFLPGNRYYVGRIETGSLSGTIIVDIDTGNYHFLEQKVMTFCSATSFDQPDFVMGQELQPNIMDESAVQTELRESANSF